MKIFYKFFFLFLFTLSLSFSNEPIGLYLTLESDPLTSMTVRWLANKNDFNDQLSYKKIDSNEWQIAETQKISMPDREPFILYYCHLLNLSPNCCYEFKINSSEKKYSFKTFPQELDKLSFIVGGDMYHDDIDTFSQMNKNASQLNPDFILLGGDLAYSAPKFGLFSENVKKWIDWLKVCKKTFILPNGKIIPLILAIGNHEVTGRYNKSPNEAKYFYTFFRSPNKSGYYNLQFSNYLSLYILDSGHTNSIHGIQTQWLKNTLELTKEESQKFAIYHVPAFPSIRNFNQEISKNIRKYWVPLFEKYGFKAAFEHHDHAYKRTYPLINYKIDPNGVLYLGDGAWGVEKPRISKYKNNPFLAKTASKQHFIFITLTKEYQKFEAIDNNKEIFDIFLRLN